VGEGLVVPEALRWLVIKVLDVWEDLVVVIWGDLLVG
jgi:hypothetical protein